MNFPKPVQVPKCLHVHTSKRHGISLTKKKKSFSLIFVLRRRAVTCVRLNALKVAVRRLRTAAAAAKEAGEGEGFSFYSD